MLKKIDWYIIRKFISSFTFAIMAFVIIAVVIDISENVDRLVESGATVWEITLGYYLPFCVFFGNLLSPFIIFLAVIWLTSIMSQRTEIVAILCGGVSYMRLLRPFGVIAVFMTISILIASHFLVPFSNRIQFDFESQYTRGVHHYSYNLHRELEPNKMYYFHHIDARKSSGYHLAIEDWKDGALTKKLFASKAHYDSISQNWELFNAVERTYLEGGQERLKILGNIDTTMALTFYDLDAPSELVFNMTTPELSEHIKKEELKGSGNVASLKLEKYMRTSNAFSILVLVFIAVPIASRKKRGGLGLHIFLAIILGIVYIFFSRMSSVAATNVGLAPAFAVWIPNILYLILGIFIYRRAPK